MTNTKKNEFSGVQINTYMLINLLKERKFVEAWPVPMPSRGDGLKRLKWELQGDAVHFGQTDIAPCVTLPIPPLSDTNPVVFVPEPKLDECQKAFGLTRSDIQDYLKFVTQMVSACSA